jgi:hypothetical protein
MTPEHPPYDGPVDYGPRYQLLDYAADESPLWDCRGPIGMHPLEGEPYKLHLERTPDELRPELERLLRAGHVELYNMKDRTKVSLSLDDALGAIGDDHNWYSPLALGEQEDRDVIYTLFLTDSGIEEFRREHLARTQAT